MDKSQPKYLTLNEWAERHFARPPSIYVLRSMARLGRFQPPPLKIGQAYYTTESAALLECGPPLPVNWNAEEVTRARSEIRAAKTTALYRHFDARGALLYVGISLSPIERLRKHADASHWARSIAKVEIQAYSDRKTALAAEKRAIKQERPLHNIIHAKKQ